MLIAFTLLSLWFGLVVHQVQCEKRAAAAIRAARGEIVYDWQVRRPNSDPKLQPSPPGPQWLRTRLGAHWFDNIVEVRLNGYVNRSSKNRFAVVGPHLVKRRALRSLTLRGGVLDGDDYHLLGQLTQLEELRLRQDAEITPQDAAAISHSTGLREIHLDEANISPQALGELARLPNLEVVDIDCSSYDRSTGVARTDHQLGDEAAAALARCSKLRSLMLFFTQISDEGMASLSQLSRLETLVVSSPKITSASFDHVAKLQHLEHLGTWQWKIDNSHFEKLSQLPRLRSLGLVTRLTDKSVPYLMKLDKIERLTLCGKGITDACLSHFHDLRNLEWLYIKDTSVTKNGQPAKDLQDSLPKCTIIFPLTDREEALRRAFLNARAVPLFL